MKIITIESYDSELGYDEEQYYEINNYKNMVVYAQKNKHKQGLEGITLDFDLLIEDLKKKKILIKSEFENIKESDLEKYYDYYILPDDFVDDIIIQLGYEPSKKRTYKDNKVKYHDDIISDIEFEQIITDKNNNLHWLIEAKFKDADIKIKKTGFSDDYLVFMSGTWINGTWKDGIFENSIWKKGIWKYGKFRESTWQKGIWEDGWFENAVWVDGTWKKGNFSDNSVWKKGIWEYGMFSDSIWEKGTWQSGNFRGSTWEKGLWGRGKFNESTWLDGNWEDGDFSDSTWVKGDWEKGLFINSNWEDGNWESGDFYNSIWEKGNWENGCFEESTWKQGTWENGVWIIATSNKITNIKKFNPKKIQFSVMNIRSATKFSFDELWNSPEMLDYILDRYYKKNSDILYIGNHKLTKRQIEKRIKEIS